MGKELKSLDEIREMLEDNVGNEMIVTVQLGRRKQKERRGILKEVYRSVFIVDLDQDRHDFERVSYSYTDILTDSIEIEFVN